MSGSGLLPDLHTGLNFAENCVYEIEANSLISKFFELFEDKLGTYNDLEVSFELDSTKTPRSYKARNVPYAMNAKVDAELDCLLERNIIVPVSHSNWAAPIVPVLKEDRIIRIFGFTTLQ